jgi:hypothetical protein
MNKYIKISIFLFLLSGVGSSCKKKFLEVIPKGKLVATTYSDYDLLMNSVAFYQYFGGGGWQVPVLLGDEIAAEENNFRSANTQIQRLFRWEPVVYEQTETAPDITIALSNIYSFNKIINEVMDAEGGTPEQKRALRAEALASRAYTYFQLVNFYAKPYAVATAAMDPGFPLNTTSDITKNDFERGTVQGVYDFIITDLKEAIVALPVQPVIQTRLSRVAAESILGKVYLFMGKAGEALPLLNNAFTDLASWTVPARLYDYNVTLGTGGSFLPIGANGPVSPFVNYNDFTETILAKTFQNFAANGSYGVVISPATAALYGADDLRLKFYSATYPNGSPNPGGRLRKYGVQYSKFGVELRELYLLRAECKARLNELPGAITDVETLRRNRMPDPAVPAAIAGDQQALIRFVIEERIREFAAEGYRWFDMRRLSVDPLFTSLNFTHTLFLTAGGTTVYTLERPNRLVLRLPFNITSNNPGMANNP